MEISGKSEENSLHKGLRQSTWGNFRRGQGKIKTGRACK